MSIKGIDTQIMIQRTTDFSRETSNIQRQPELAQEHLAAQGKIESTQEQQRVLATNESEMDNIRTDVDEEGQGAEGGGGGSGKEEEEMTEEQQKELLVAPADHDQLIDIYL